MLPPQGVCLHEETQVEEERRTVEGHRLGIFIKDVHPLPASAVSTWGPQDPSLKPRMGWGNPNWTFKYPWLNANHFCNIVIHQISPAFFKDTWIKSQEYHKDHQFSWLKPQCSFNHPDCEIHPFHHHKKPAPSWGFRKVPRRGPRRPLINVVQRLSPNHHH